MTRNQAREQGYRALTKGYALPAEQWMMGNVISDMKRGDIEHILMHTEYGTEVWRKGMFRVEEDELKAAA